MSHTTEFVSVCVSVSPHMVCAGMKVGLERLEKFVRHCCHVPYLTCKSKATKKKKKEAYWKSQNTEGIPSSSTPYTHPRKMLTATTTQWHKLCTLCRLSQAHFNPTAQPVKPPSFLCKAACETELLSHSHPLRQHNGFCLEGLAAVTSLATTTGCIKAQLPQPVPSTLYTPSTHRSIIFLLGRCCVTGDLIHSFAGSGTVSGCSVNLLSFVRTLKVN